MKTISMDQIRFRIAVDADAQGINNLVNSVYRGEHSKRGWTTEAEMLGGQRTDPGQIRDMIKHSGQVILIAVIGENIVGCVHLEKKGKVCYLGMLSVNVNMQGHGIGKLLMDKGESYARTSFDCIQMEMTVIGQREELIEYYERRGYRMSGEKRVFPQNDPRFGIPKRSDLYFEVLIKDL